MIESRQDVALLPRIFAVKEPDPPVPDASTTVTYFAALKAEVFEPMVQQLAALEEGSVGAERAASAKYRTEVERFAAATAARVASAR